MFTPRDWRDRDDLLGSVRRALEAAARGTRSTRRPGNAAAARLPTHSSYLPRQPRSRLMTTWDMRFRALPGIPLIQPGDVLPALIAEAAEADGLALADADVVVVAQKVVSKAGGASSASPT
jgi:hypothetical protein